MIYDENNFLTNNELVVVKDIWSSWHMSLSTSELNIPNILGLFTRHLT